MKKIEKVEILGEVPIEYSARHVHLSQEHQDALFGAGYSMTKLKELSQAGQYAYEEKVTVRGPKGEFLARVLGPCRTRTQVELAWSDGRRIGVETPVRVSGDLDGTGACTLVGPKGSVELEEGVINDRRHLHVNPEDAARLSVKHGDTVAVEAPGLTPAVFEDVAVRVHESFRMNIHLDTDEANACSLDAQGEKGRLIRLWRN